MRPTRLTMALMAVLAIGSVASADDRGRDRGRDSRPAPRHGEFRGGGHDRFDRGGFDGFRRHHGRFYRRYDYGFRYAKPRPPGPWFNPWYPTPFPGRVW